MEVLLRHPVTRTILAAVTIAAAVAGCGGTESPAPLSTTPHPQSAQAQGSGPSFDCAKLNPATAHRVESVVCSDPQLATLDRQLTAEYDHAVAAAGPNEAALESAQQGWITSRDDCAKADDTHRCVLESYRTRLVELKMNDPDTVKPATVTYRCLDPTPFTARFYHQFDPPAAVLTRGGDSAIVFAQQSGSGARYGRVGVDYWEHQGEVTVDFHGDKFVCRTP